MLVVRYLSLRLVCLVISSCQLSIAWITALPPANFVSSCNRPAIGDAFSSFSPSSTITTTKPRPRSSLSMSSIEFQSDDTNKYGRGEMHLSAMLDENDVVVYQTGYWYVDGVLVGDYGSSSNNNNNNSDAENNDDDASFEYCQVENVQVVWTHNCEHGVIRGWRLLPRTSGETTAAAAAATTTVDVLQRTDEFVEFGPEQLLAKIPVEWDESDETKCRPLLPIGDTLWKKHMMTG